MRKLVALDMAAGPTLVEQVLQRWDEGDAVLVVDQRLPQPAKRELVTELGVHEIATAGGATTLSTTNPPMDDGDALVVATSGSTGMSKGVVHTHDGLRSASLSSATALRCGADAHWLACLPLSHIGGFGVVTRALHTGARLTVHSSFDPVAALDVGASHVSLVATALQRIDATRFTRVLLGGSRPPANLPANVTPTYGLTESCGGIVYDRQPIPGVEVTVSASGEVLLRGPMIMRGYRNMSRDIGHPIDENGWLHTGDLGELRGEELHVAGRAGDLIITGGENVWPEQVESALSTHPLVRDVVVAGANDAEWGQRVVAWIVTDGSEISLDALRDHVSSVLPRFAAPRQLVIVERIPRTALGKPRRNELVKQLESLS
jgi:O-succinylbenzoic acid--CoA ligase